MQKMNELYDRMIKAMGLTETAIPAAFVKIYSQNDEIPEAVYEYETGEVTLTSCQAARQASIGDAVCLTKNNIGCIAAAITFGLVDQNEDKPLEKPRVYTEIMRSHAQNKNEFTPPSPKDFTEGLVYACADSGRKDFSLFGPDDSGRFKDVETAKAAVMEMTAIQPATTKAVFFCSAAFNDIDIQADVVVLSLRPVELTRIVQAYQYMTGKRVKADMGGLRAVNSDLIVRPFLTGEINISPYCLGSRIIASYEANKIGIGIPMKLFEIIVEGLERSKTGYPFELYPGAVS
jgi:uncharacterized protein (DUF169 family)